MDYSQPFSVLNDKMRPRFTTTEQLNSSLERLEDRPFGSLGRKSPSRRATVLPEDLEPHAPVNTAESEDSEEAEDDAGQGDLGPEGLEEASRADSLPLVRLSEEEAADEEESASQSEDKDSPDELASEGAMGSSESGGLTGEGGRRVQGSPYFDGTVPDLIKSGRPLARRRTLGHVSATLSEVRREVELSRRRSIRLKAQVDKLQESRDGPGWSQRRERVTEEVLSVLRLLRPLAEPEPSTPEPSPGEQCLDAALTQLQDVARKLAIGHTTQETRSKEAKGAEESAVLQQALRDRDEAIEKKKAMEAELLKSKTELMLLNNQLLEAVQKRLELSLELEAWKEDVQLIIQQQVQSQQAEQAQKKTSRMGILRRNKPATQRPSNFPLPTPTPPTVNSNQIFITSSARAAAPTSSPRPSFGTQHNWRDKLRRGKSSHHADQDVPGQNPERGGNDGFQVISLD